MKTSASVLFFLFCFGSFAQTTEDYYAPAKPKTTVKERISGSVMAGTSVSFLNNSKSTAVTTFIAPRINYSLSKKFSLTAGLIHYSFSPGFSAGRSESFLVSGKRNLSGNLVFAGGEYKLNKRVLLSGAVMVDANGMNKRQNMYKAASIGMDYKITEHSSIGFRATVSQGNMDYNFDPKRGSYEYRPFTNNSFGNVFTGFGEWGAEGLNRAIR
ncbi:MAG: hypothetical protein JWO44_2142 [Bacteroidetes bacterium]|nr:hypothetical protein [Bacteroidota bacterium]